MKDITILIDVLWITVVGLIAYTVSLRIKISALARKIVEISFAYNANTVATWQALEKINDGKIDLNSICRDAMRKEREKIDGIRKGKNQAEDK